MIVCGVAALGLETPRAQGRPAAAARPLAALAHDIDTIVSAPPLTHGFWGIVIKPAKNDGETWYSMNGAKLMMPASSMKVITLAAAAQRLGWNFTYETQVFAAGPISEGALHGDLIVVGSGDPSLDDWDGNATRLFVSWAERLKSIGVQRIDGRIIGDDNVFDDEGLGRGWSWDDLPAGFAAAVGGLQFNENTLQVSVHPGDSVGAPGHVTFSPREGPLTLRNRIVTGPAGSAPFLVRRRNPGSNVLDLRGSIPLRSAPMVQNVSIDNPTLFFVSTLRDVLIAQGIDVRGDAVDIDDLNPPPARSSGAPVVAYRSEPLSVLAGTLMKLSQNQYAETLLRTLGTSSGSGTPEAGLAAIRGVLDEWNIPGGLVQVDGSGLSRYNYVTPETLVAVLTHVDRDETLRTPYEAALPIAGRDAGLLARMKGTPAEGNARVKTGSMAQVRAAAGLVDTADGEKVVFAIVANNFDAPATAVAQAEDAIIARIARVKR